MMMVQQWVIRAKVPNLIWDRKPRDEWNALIQRGIDNVNGGWRVYFLRPVDRSFAFTTVEMNAIPFGSILILALAAIIAVALLATSIVWKKIEEQEFNFKLETQENILKAAKENLISKEDTAQLLGAAVQEPTTIFSQAAESLTSPSFTLPALAIGAIAILFLTQRKR